MFSGTGGSDYRNARFSESGWCASKSHSYLLLDLQKEYHLTHVVVMGNQHQTIWSTSYSMQYGRAEFSVERGYVIQVFTTGNLLVCFTRRFSYIELNGGQPQMYQQFCCT